MGRRSTLPPLTREQQDRAAAYSDRVGGIAFKFASRRRLYRDIHDIQSDALYGLCQAARLFDPARNNDFLAYATNRIKGAMLDGVRRRLPLTRCHRAEGANAPMFLSLEDRIPEDDEPVGFDLEQEDQVAYLLRGLRGVEKHVIRRIYVDGATGDIIGREIGVSASRVSQLRKRALVLLLSRFRGCCAGE